MVGRFVQNQEVHRLQQQLNHSQTGTFSAGKHFYFLIRSFTAKHESTQNITYLQPDIPRRHPVDRIKYRHVLIQHLRLILCKVADLYVMPNRQFAIKINLAHNTFYQCGLTFSVLSDKCYFFSSVNRQIHIVENNMMSVCLTYIFANNRIISATAGRGEFQTEGRVVFLVHFNAVYFFQLFDTALYLYGFGCLITETFDKVFRILYLFLLILVSTELLFTTFFA